MSATFCNALAFFTLHSLKNYDIGKKELSWSYTATFATIRRIQATTISSVCFFFWCELSSKGHKSFLCCLLGHTIISFFLSHRTSLFQSTQYYRYSIMVKPSYSSIRLSLFLFKLLFSHAHFSCQLVWHCRLYLLMTWESSYLFISC